MRSEKEPVSHQRESESRLPGVQSMGHPFGLPDHIYPFQVLNHTGSSGL